MLMAMAGVVHPLDLTVQHHPPMITVAAVRPTAAVVQRLGKYLKRRSGTRMEAL